MRAPIDRPAARQCLLVRPVGEPGGPEGDDVAWLAAELGARFGLDGRAGAPVPPDEAGCTGAGACDSDALLAALADSRAEGWSLAVTGRDLSAPTRPWVFGVALLGGCCAVVSTARLGGGEAARGRLLTEAVHELGHLAGLPHCTRAWCAMAPAASLAEVDRKTPDFCDACLAALDASGSPRRT